MSLIKFNRNRFPWSNMGWLDTDNFFDDDFFSRKESLPAINIKESEDTFDIELAAPGFDKKDFEVTLDEHILQVSAEKQIEREEEENNYTRKEFSYNSFRKSLQLPNTVDETKEIKATYKNGILNLQLQKKEEAKTTPKKVIEVN